MRHVHRATGTPVLVKADRKLNHTSKSTLAIANKYHPLAHLIHFDPYMRIAVDYFVTFQCGKLLRFFAPPREDISVLIPLPPFLDRVRPFAPVDPRSEQALLMRCHGKMVHSAAYLSTMRIKLFREVHAFMIDEAAIRLSLTLLGHICAVPVDLRVDAWLADVYPRLGTFQYILLTDSLDGRLVIRPPIRRESTPELFWPTADALNAAHTLFWSQRFDRPRTMQPYDEAGLRPLAEELLAIWHSVPAEKENDGELIDRWSRALGVAAWREWVEYECASLRPFEPSRWLQGLAREMESGSWAVELDPSMT